MLSRFKIIEVISIAALIQSLRLSYDGTIHKVGGGFPLGDRDLLLGQSAKAYTVFASIGFEKATRAAWHFRKELEDNKVRDYSCARTHLFSLELAIFEDSNTHRFIQIRPDRAKFLPWPRGKSKPDRHGFGAEVDEAFPSALDDINEAGYCIAVEANTGAVYHLMCAVEHGLRALAEDRRVTFPKGPIALQQWGDILRELEKKVADINNWPKSKSREAALEFFNRALKDCRSFNEAYRRHVAHARRHYDRHEALSVMSHVRDFMQLLATRISERKKTPLVWKRA